MSLATDFKNLVMVTTPTTGQTTPMLLGAAVTGYRGVAGYLVDGQTYAYSILGAAGLQEDGHGVYSSAGGSITRVVDDSSAGGTTRVSLVGGEKVILGHVLATDLLYPLIGVAGNRTFQDKVIEKVDLRDAYSPSLDGSDFGLAFNRVVAHLLSVAQRGQLKGGLIDMNNLGVIQMSTQCLIDLNNLVANIAVEGFGTIVKTNPATAMSAFKTQRVNYVGPSVTYRGMMVDCRGGTAQTEAFDIAGACRTLIDESVMIIGDGSVPAGWAGVRLRQYDQTDANTGAFSCTIWPRIWSDTNPAFLPVGIQVEGQCNGWDTSRARIENVASAVRVIRPQGAGATHDLCNAGMATGMQVEHATYGVEIVDESGHPNISGLQMKFGRYENCGYLLAFTGSGGADTQFPPQVDGNFQTQDIGTVVCTASFSGTTMTVTDLTSIPLAGGGNGTGRVVIGQALTFTAQTGSPTVVAQLTGQLGGLGTYQVSVSQGTLAARTVSGQTTSWVYNPHGVQMGCLITRSLGALTEQDYSYNQNGWMIEASNAATAALVVSNLNGFLQDWYIKGAGVIARMSGLFNGLWCGIASPNGSVLFNHQINGISQTNTINSYNLAGVSGAFPGGASNHKAVTFANTEPNANYRVQATPNAAIAGPWWVTGKGTGGFTINTTDTAYTGTFDWLKIQD